MGHKFSKNQRMLHIADRAKESEVRSVGVEQQQEEEEEGPTPGQSLITVDTVDQQPKSVVITIRMLKMERRDTNQLNNLNQNFKSSCMILPPAATTHYPSSQSNCCQQHQQQLNRLNCLHCNCQCNQQQQSARPSFQIQDYHGNDLQTRNFNINFCETHIQNHLAHDEDVDNSNVLLDQSNPLSSSNVCGNLFNCDTKSNCNNVIASTSSSSVMDRFSVNSNSGLGINGNERDVNHCNGNVIVENAKTTIQNDNVKVPAAVATNSGNSFPNIGGAAPQSNDNVLNTNNLNTSNIDRCAQRSQSTVPLNSDQQFEMNNFESSAQEDNLRRNQPVSPVITSKWNSCCKLCNICKDGKESKKSDWSLKFNCAQLKCTKPTNISVTKGTTSNAIVQVQTETPSQCLCIDPKTNENGMQQQLQQQPQVPSQSMISTIANVSNSLLFDKSSVHEHGNLILVPSSPLLDFSKFNPDEYPIEDCDEKARIQRALEIAEGVEPPPGFTPSQNIVGQVEHHHHHHNHNHANDLNVTAQQPVIPNISQNVTQSQITQPHWHMVCSNDSTTLHIVLQNIIQGPGEIPRLVHSQVDYIHCLVPDLKKITNSCFYWGKMDRYEAERLLEGKPEGTFLLRDSAQEEFLFSVSFRKYGRSLHARIEQFNHKFSFDCHDPGVYTSSTVTGLLKHYEDPACVMFFEPALTLPLNRNFCFSLQQLCRATIVSHTTYDGVNKLSLPATLKSYLKEYHYKQRVRINRFDEPMYSIS